MGPIDDTTGNASASTVAVAMAAPVSPVSTGREEDAEKAANRIPARPYTEEKGGKYVHAIYVTLHPA